MRLADQAKAGIDVVNPRSLDTYSPIDKVFFLCGFVRLYADDLNGEERFFVSPMGRVFYSRTHETYRETGENIYDIEVSWVEKDIDFMSFFENRKG